MTEHQVPASGAADGDLEARARELLQSGRYAEAEVAYVELARRVPDRPAGLVGLALVATHAQRWQTALERWDECLARFPTRQPPFWRLMRCRTLGRMGRHGEAEAAFEMEASRSPGDATALVQLYETLANQWVPARKLALLDRIAAIAPADRWCRGTRAMVVAMSGDLAQGRAIVQAMLDEAPVTKRWSVSELTLVFRAVQLCCRDHQRVVLLQRLAALCRDLADTGREVAAELLLARLHLALGDHAETARLVTGLQSRGVEQEIVTEMAEICARRSAAAYPDFDAPKIFCIGLSKTATSSLDAALRMLGLQTVHWANRFTQTLLSESDLFLFDGFSDIVVSWRFESLYTTFPNARFIYTTRNMADWVQSITAHYARLHGLSRPSDLAGAGFRERCDGAAGMAEMSLYARHDSWEAAYAEFDRRVRHYFSDKPADKWLEMAVCDGEGWETLCGFLGRPVPDRPFPATNAAPRPD